MLDPQSAPGNKNTVKGGKGGGGGGGPPINPLPETLDSRTSKAVEEGAEADATADKAPEGTAGSAMNP